MTIFPVFCVNFLPRWSEMVLCSSLNVKVVRISNKACVIGNHDSLQGLLLSCVALFCLSLSVCLCLRVMLYVCGVVCCVAVCCGLSESMSVGPER